MQHVTTYTFKPFMTQEETKALLEAFAEFGNAPGTTVGENEDFAALYRNILNYLEFVEFEQHVVIPVEDGVPMIAEYVSS